MAAEAGLIDPEPEKEVPAEKEILPAGESTEAAVTMMETENDDSEAAAAVAAAEATSGEVEAPVEAPNVGLFGGSTIYEKLGLKGGSKIRLGLFGGSPVGPPVTPFTYRGGLFGGSKDTTEVNNQEAPVVSETGDIPQASVNGSLKKQEDEGEADEFKMDFEESSEKTDGSQKSEQESGFSSMHSQDSNEDLKKEETGDALSALASAALDHSKEFKTENTENTIKEEKDTWYTVGFIKGNSFDVQHYFHCEEDSSNFTVDNLPDLSHFAKINLEPGTAYKFRVAAINSVGRGEWSEVRTSISLHEMTLEYQHF